MGKKLKKKIYWDIEKGADYNIFFKPKKKEDIEATFDNNLKNYLISDKQSILALSSGKDSQILNESLKRIEKSKIHPAITIGFEERTFDEMFNYYQQNQPVVVDFVIFILDPFISIIVNIIIIN